MKTFIMTLQMLYGIATYLRYLDFNLLIIVIIHCRKFKFWFSDEMLTKILLFEKQNKRFWKVVTFVVTLDREKHNQGKMNNVSIV